MTFLVDNALSPLIARGLVAEGYDAVHVRDLGMAAASDREIFELAAQQNQISSLQIPTLVHFWQFGKRRNHRSFCFGKRTSALHRS